MPMADQLDANTVLEGYLHHHSERPSNTITEDDDEAEKKKPPTTVAQVFQCPVGPHVIEDAVKLPCGQCLCRRCLPPSYKRDGIEKTWPGTPDRADALSCPCCLKEHPTGECWPDYLANNAVTLVQVLVVSNLTSQSTLPNGQDGQALMKALENLHLDPITHDDDDGNGDAAMTLNNSTRLTSVVSKIEAALRPEMDCPICHLLLYRPWTTPCGHTFCQHCITRSAAINTLCPSCRTPMLTQHLSPQNRSLNYFITRVTKYFWSEDLVQREEHVRADSPYPLADGGLNVPIFVCTVALPRMPMLLHVFEHKYREMIKRVYDGGNGGKQFGMITGRAAIGEGSIGVHLRITELTMLPDGRSLIESIGVSRFRVKRNAIHPDGYMVAEVEDLDDVSLAEEEFIEVEELRRAGLGLPANFVPVTGEELDMMSTKELMAFARATIQELHEYSPPWLSSRILAIYGQCPDDPALFPWWLGSIIPLDELQKARLLEQNTVRKRLKMCCVWILEWNARRQSSW